MLTKNRDTTIHFEDDDLYTFKTTRTFELLDHETPFLESSKIKELSAAGKQHLSNIKEDIKEMLEPFMNGVGHVGKMFPSNWIPIIECKQHPNMVDGPPTSLAAVARGQAPLSIVPHLATKLTARYSTSNVVAADIPEVSSKESSSSDSISRNTPPRSNLSTIGSHEGNHHVRYHSKNTSHHDGEDTTDLYSDKKEAPTKPCHKKYTMKIIPGRESTEKMKQRLMNPRTEKTAFRRCIEGSKESSLGRVPMDPESTMPGQSSNISKCLLQEPPGQHVPSGTRPESPIRLLSFDEDDAEKILSALLADSDHDIIDEDNETTKEQDLGDATESVIAAAEHALASAGRKLIWSTTSSEKIGLQPEELLETRKPNGKAARPDSVSLPLAEERAEINEVTEGLEIHPKREKDEEREPCYNSQSKSERETEDGERESILSSSDGKIDVDEDTDVKDDTHSALFSSFSVAMQSSKEHIPKSKSLFKPVLVSRRYLSDTSDDESDTSTNYSTTTHSRESISHSDHTSQWDYETSRHSVYSTDASSMLYSDRGEPLSSIGENSSMDETTDQEVTTDEESFLVFRAKSTLFSQFRSRPIKPPRFRTFPKPF
jgi:hypothetical protein